MSTESNGGNMIRVYVSNEAQEKLRSISRRRFDQRYAASAELERQEQVLMEEAIEQYVDREWAPE